MRDADVVSDLLHAHAVPPVMLGIAPQPRSPKEAAMHKIVYMRTVGMDPWLSDDRDVLAVLAAEAYEQMALPRRRDVP